MTETDTCDEMAILRRIPTNCHTTPARQWIVGDRDDSDALTDEEIEQIKADPVLELSDFTSETVATDGGQLEKSQ